MLLCMRRKKSNYVVVIHIFATVPKNLTLDPDQGGKKILGFCLCCHVDGDAQVDVRGREAWIQCTLSFLAVDLRPGCVERLPTSLPHFTVASPA
jgi:hypothetical protein